MCKCRKKLTDKLINDCTKTIEETKLVNITFNENEKNYECCSCIVYIVLMIVAFTISTGITLYLAYYNCSLINNKIHCIKFNNYKKKKIDEYNNIKWTQQNKWILKIELIILTMILLILKILMQDY